MGIIVSPFEYHNQALSDSGKLVVFCNENNKAKDALSLNVELAKKLSLISERKKTMFMERYVSELIPHDINVVIKDIDVMFNPNYEIDVLKILTNIRKYKQFCVIWPGTLKDNSLVYAEPEYADYRVFNVDNYDIICVK